MYDAGHTQIPNVLIEPDDVFVTMSVDSIRLPRELLRLVLDELEPNPDEPIPVDRRRFLSQESLDRPSPPPRSCIEDIASFRLACKQFADVGAPLLFTRVVIRLSKRDLKRLETLAGWEVSKHVKRFSYLVPYFFENRANLDITRMLIVTDSS